MVLSEERREASRQTSRTPKAVPGDPVLRNALTWLDKEPRRQNVTRATGTLPRFNDRWLRKVLLPTKSCWSTEEEGTAKHASAAVRDRFMASINRNSYQKTPGCLQDYRSKQVSENLNARATRKLHPPIILCFNLPGYAPGTGSTMTWHRATHRLLRSTNTEPCTLPDRLKTRNG